MTPSKILLYFSCSFLTGVAFTALAPIPRPFLLGFFIVGLMFTAVLWKRKKLVVIGLCFIVAGLGAASYQKAVSQERESLLQYYVDIEQVVAITGIIVKEPDVRNNNTKIIIAPDLINNQSARSRKKLGRVLVTTDSYPEYAYGDRVAIRGDLQAPQVFEDFNYKRYLAKDGIYAVMYWPTINLLAVRQGNLLYGKILEFKKRLRESVYQNLSPPHSSVLAAMLLGDKSRISSVLKEKLNTAGVRHITAVSGMHVVIVSSIVMSVFVGLGFWRGQALYGSMLLIALFVIMTGVQPSGVRAGIMGGLLLLGQHLGRQSTSSRTIVMAAALMVAFNPLLLLDDVGFQLSFLAAIGIIHFGPILKQYLRFLPQDNFVHVRDIIAMTFAAYLFTLPILIYNFGRISLVALITNVLIVPVLYMIMVSGFLMALLGALWGPVGWVVSLPAKLLLVYVITIVNIFSHPWAARTIENVHWVWLLAAYSILGYTTWQLKKRARLKFLS